MRNLMNTDSQVSFSLVKQIFWDGTLASVRREEEEGEEKEGYVDEDKAKAEWEARVRDSQFSVLFLDFSFMNFHLLEWF